VSRVQSGAVCPECLETHPPGVLSGVLSGVAFAKPEAAPSS